MKLTSLLIFGFLFCWEVNSAPVDNDTVTSQEEEEIPEYGDVSGPFPEELEVDPWTLDAEMGLVPPKNSNKTEENFGEAPKTPQRGLILLGFNGRGASLWPNGIVYYRFENSDRRQMLDADSEDMIIIAMQSIQAATRNCIRFYEDTAGSRTSGVIIFQGRKKTTDNFGDVTYEATCESECLGMCTGGPMKVIITPMNCEYVKGNYAGSVAHEVMHALGFGHEFSRNDRDRYFQFKNPRDSQRYGVLPDNTQGIPMNYKSIMNYDFDKSTIQLPNPPQKPLGSIKNFGQECRISAGDRNLIERTYFTTCRANRRPLTEYKKDFRIPGTDCSYRIAAEENDADGFDDV